MRAGERSARGLALITFGFSRRACGPRRRSSPRCPLLKVPFIDKPSQTLSPTRPKSSRSASNVGLPVNYIIPFSPFGEYRQTRAIIKSDSRLAVDRFFSSLV